MTEQVENQEETEQTDETSDDQLLQLPPEKLVAMVRDKRKAEATYRTKLRDTEAERDKLSETVGGYQKSAFSDFAKSQRVLDSAVDDVAGSLDVSELLDESGQVDQEKATAALEELKQSKPHYFQRPPMQTGTDRVGGSGEGNVKPEASWGDVLR
ncbi:hypothetical protein [Arthrobacter castelli]|uniref:hypothetical protein n=1 Tax=Arthrobacter castelli TaxID=271431 RepID=UPI0003FD0DBE|nr:hypothetical protein [Arthrobacter castelli]